MAERTEELDTEAPEAAASGSDGLAAALAAMLRRRAGGPKHDPKFDAFLDKQSRLIDLQTEHLHEQRALILSRLRWGRFSDRVKALLQVLTLLVGLAIVVAVAAMAWQAHEDHGVTIEAFSVPPDFAQRGLTGQVVASRLLGRIADLQARTITARPASSYENDWGDDIKVEIPETGVSIGELNRYLRDWLGSETRITGDVVRTPTGIAVTAQTGASAGRTFEGTDADIDKLIGQTAEAVYAQTQPYRYAVYLQSEGKADQALQAYERLAQSAAASPEERGWAYSGWAGLLLNGHDPRGALAKAIDAIRLDPRNEGAYAVVYNANHELGRTRDAIVSARAGLKLLVSGRADGGSPEGNRATISFIRDVILPAFYGDSASALAAARRNAGRAVFEGGGGYAFQNADVGQLIDLHDVSDALRLQPADMPLDLGTRVQAAVALDDWRTALVALDHDPATTSSEPSAQAWRAVLLARLGRIAEAEAAIAQTAPDCTECVMARGEIAAFAGDRKSADRWFGEAAREAPLPDEFLNWGQSLLLLGDPDAAIVELKRAHEVGPHYADPLEVWGEALMAKHDYAGAIARFAEADKDAPKWGRNHLRWGEALMLSGRYAEARTQYQAASGLDLGVGDRAALNVLLARTAKGPLHG